MLGVSGTPVLDAVGKLGDLGDRLSGKNVRSLPSDSWTDDPTGRAAGWMRLRYIFSTTIRSDGDYPLEGFPCDWTLTIRFGMAVDAINVSEPTYLFDLSTVRLVFPCILLTVRLIGARLTIRTCPLMGRTYSRLGATLGSPKLRLLSLLSHFRLLLSVLSLRSSKLFLDL